MKFIFTYSFFDKVSYLFTSGIDLIAVFVYIWSWQSFLKEVFQFFWNFNIIFQKFITFSNSFILSRRFLLLKLKDFTVFQSYLLSDSREVFSLLKKNFFLFFVESALVIYLGMLSVFLKYNNIDFSCRFKSIKFAKTCSLK